MADDDFADGTHIAEGNASWMFMLAMQNQTSPNLCAFHRPPKTRSGCNRQGGSLLDGKRDRSKTGRSVRRKVQLFGFALLKAWEMMKEFDKAGFLGPANSILQYPDGFDMLG
jgi:hypothetical protein